jgi:hypothetical protein
MRSDRRPGSSMSATHSTGEAPGAGTYYCMECGWRIYLETNQQLPYCERCLRPGESRFYHFL